MKYFYRGLRPLLAVLLVFVVLSTSAQAWRPFRPGQVYRYALRNSTDICRAPAETAARPVRWC